MWVVIGEFKYCLACFEQFKINTNQKCNCK